MSNSTPLPPPLPGAPVTSAEPAKRSASRSVLWTVAARVLMFSVFVAAVGLVCWSLYQLYVTIPPLTRQLRQKDTERSRLASEVQQLEMDWNAAAAEKLEREYQAAQEMVFADADGPARWADEMKLRARQLAFDADLQVSPAEPAACKEIAVVPAVITLQPTRLGGGLTNSPYERLLKLASALEASPRRIDFIGLSVTSDSNSVAQTRAHFQLWVKAREAAKP
jgi:outer membrane murein-binding lipoprotein Lpp